MGLDFKEDQGVDGADVCVSVCVCPGWVGVYMCNGCMWMSHMSVTESLGQVVCETQRCVCYSYPVFTAGSVSPRV